MMEDLSKRVVITKKMLEAGFAEVPIPDIDLAAIYRAMTLARERELRAETIPRSGISRVAATAG